MKNVAVRLLDAIRPKPLMTSVESDLGNVLLRMGAVTPDDLRAAVGEQSRDREQHLLGALLVARGVITESALSDALALQGKMRNGRAAEAMLDLVEAKTDRAAIRFLKPEPA